MKLRWAWQTRAISLAALVAAALTQAAAADRQTVYEDDVIRVLSMALPAGSSTRDPRPHDSVNVFDRPGKVVEADAAGRIEALATLDALATPTGEPFIALLAGGSPHTLINQDSRDVHLIRVEFKRGMRAPKILAPFSGKGPMPASTDGTDPRTWNPAEEALVAAPANHKVVFETDKLRVLSVTDPPGDEERFHRHPWPSVAVFDRITYSVLRGPDEQPLRQDVLEEHTPTVLVLPAQALHRISNPDTRPEHLTRIEFKHGFAP